MDQIEKLPPFLIYKQNTPTAFALMNFLSWIKNWQIAGKAWFVHTLGKKFGVGMHNVGVDMPMY